MIATVLVIPSSQDFHYLILTYISSFIGVFYKIGLLFSNILFFLSAEMVAIQSNWMIAGQNTSDEDCVNTLEEIHRWNCSGASIYLEVVKTDRFEYSFMRHFMIAFILNVG